MYEPGATLHIFKQKFMKKLDFEHGSINKFGSVNQGYNKGMIDSFKTTSSLSGSL